MFALHPRDRGLHRPVRAPPQPEGRNFVARHYVDEEGRRRVRIDWRVPEYELAHNRGRRRGFLIESCAMAKHDLGADLLELWAINNQVVLIVNLFPKTPSAPNATLGRDYHEDLKFMLCQLLVVKIHAFLEAFGAVQGKIARNRGGVDLLRRLSPIIKRLNGSREGLRTYRSQLIAHGQTGADFSSPHARILASKHRSHYGEILFLAMLVDALMQRLQRGYGTEIAQARQLVSKETSLLRPDIRQRLDMEQIRSMDDVDRALAAVLAEVDQ